MEEDPQCFQTAAHGKQTSTDTTETITELHRIMESTIWSEDNTSDENEAIAIENDAETSKQPSSPRSFSPLEHETAETVCSSDIPLEDDWFCDNRKACFHIQKYVCRSFIKHLIDIFKKHSKFLHYEVNTHCKMRCHIGEKYHRNKCVCRNGKCFWRKVVCQIFIFFYCVTF